MGGMLSSVNEKVHVFMDSSELSIYYVITCCCEDLDSVT